ncbi:response regulator [Kitasatospora cheerisanensis]|uniref:Fis family transcriptional regulator n=1 Tax=Kitasatospora cheerisanensis KCTC 2395 TaxID=1348663 RepID=A0A066YX49_9ACTN|nr:response regulator [Kitasatospora cheerisanensis]KDN84559.1 Fis family transcriptional regulator [Kitasatospora cheerisanensis KCTC 2395]
MTRVLAVDDEPRLLRTLRLNLLARQYAALTAGTARQALELAERTPPDAVLLDLGLPDRDGMDVLRALRLHSAAPVIVLSGRTDPADRIRALDEGADDYLTKPFVMDELFARLRAVLRRPAPAAAPPLARIGDHTVDPAAARATGPDGPVRLTPTEWRLLTVLLAAPGRLVTRRQLLTAVWGPGHEHHGNYLRVHFAALRRKLERDPHRPRHLVTEPGLGYRYLP